MIQLPRRSVTRFFVPLIDVLILLFCIFLLLPFVSRPENENSADLETKTDELPEDITTLKQQLILAKEQVKNLLAERADVAGRTAVRVLEIDAENGKLYYFNRESLQTKRLELRSQADAQLLIDRERQVADGKQPMFLILYPRQLSRFPTQPQLDSYRRWFRAAPHTFDNPWGSP